MNSKGVKRIYNRDGGEAEAKRQRVELDPELKRKVLTGIVHSTILLLEKIKLPFLSVWNDLYINMEFSSHYSSMMHSIRMKANNPSSSVGLVKTMAEKGFSVKYQGLNYACSYTEAMEQIAEGFAKADLRVEDIKDWAGTLNPYVALLQLFKERYQEARIGLDFLKVGRDENLKDKVVRVSEFGISAEMAPLCEGLNWKPNIQSSLAGSLGPGTALVKLQTQKDPKYQKKWKTAVERIYQHIPGIKNLTDAFVGFDTSQQAEITSKMGLITLIVGARNVQRMAFPFLVLVKFLITLIEVPVSAMEVEGGGSTSAGGVSRTNYQINNEAIKGLDFSGSGGFALYHAMQQETYVFPKMDLVDPFHVRQVVFHAIFGTAKESFGVLSTITDHRNWTKRQEMGKLMSSPSEAKTTMPMEMIKLKYCSKMRSSVLTSILSTSGEAVSSYAAFCGYRKKVITPELQNMFERATSVALQGSSYKEITESLDQLIGKIAKIIEKKEEIKEGSMNWFELTEEGYGAEVKIVVQETDEFFWSRGDDQ